MRVQRRLAAQILKCGENRIGFDGTKLDEVKEAITKNDVRSLINEGVIFRKRTLATSKFWSRKIKEQKTAGKQKGPGSRKGKKTARTPSKRQWINKIRLQRSYIRFLRQGNKITLPIYHELYMKSKGGFFRSIRHLKLYVEERGLIKK